MTCPDCRCVLTKDNKGNDTAYCDHCLRERVQAGEQVPAVHLFVDPLGKTRHIFYVVCSRCEGTGTYLVSATQEGSDCWRCWGRGWIDPDREETQRAGRWSSTFQTNKVKNRK